MSHGFDSSAVSKVKRDAGISYGTAFSEAKHQIILLDTSDRARTKREDSVAPFTSLLLYKEAG